MDNTEFIGLASVEVEEEMDPDDILAMHSRGASHSGDVTEDLFDKLGI
jgi:hypothetical protein